MDRMGAAGESRPREGDDMGIDDFVEKAKEVAGDAAEKAKEFAGDVAENAKEFGGEVKEFAGDVAEKAKDVAGDIKDRFDGDDEAPAPAADAAPSATPPAS